MSAAELERIEVELKGIKAELQRLGANPSPSLLTLQAAARSLSIGQTKLRDLVKRGVILTTTQLGRPMVPASEIARVASVPKLTGYPRVSLPPRVMPKPPPVLVARTRVRKGTPGQSQDPDELKAMLKRTRRRG